MLSVQELWRYPVKSMGFEKIAAAEIGMNGIPYDRGWAVRDERDGAIRTARLLPALLLYQARYIEGTWAGLVPHVEVSMPNGGTVRSDDPDIDRILSDSIGRPVTLWSLRPPEDSEHLRITPLEPGEMEGEWRRQMGLLPDDPMPDFSGIPAKVLNELKEYATPRGTYFDAFTMNVLTTSSMRHLQALLPDADIRVERFRPNILVDDEGESDSIREHEWVGRDIAIGGARLKVVMDCPRCTIASARQPGIDKDTRISRAMVNHMRQSISVYCEVAAPGTVQERDAVLIH